jgi:hypothetical protein
MFSITISKRNEEITKIPQSVHKIPLKTHTLHHISGHISKNSYYDFLIINTYTWITKHLSVEYNAREAVLLLVSASSDRQDFGNDAGPVT